MRVHCVGLHCHCHCVQTVGVQCAVCRDSTVTGVGALHTVGASWLPPAGLRQTEYTASGLYTVQSGSSLYMGAFAQFGLNQFKRGQKRFSQLQLSLDTDELKSCNFVCSSITARRGFAKVICRDCDHCKCPKMHLKH